MEAERWRAVDRAFEAVREVPPAARSELLFALCGDDLALRREVEELLAAEESLAADDAFLAGPLDAAAVSGLLGPGRLDDRLEIAGYRVCGLLGEGGGGAVYRATREAGAPAGGPVEVALKVGWASLSQVEGERFRREQEILSRLAHPGITCLHGFGVTAEGRPYLVMELLDGDPIDRHCDDRCLSIAERIELFLQVCAAVHHVHSIGVVHRDIKPGNVLVTRDGRAKLLDFGIAKALDSSTYHTHLDPTSSKVHLVTPGYCSPEQVKGKKVTPASDVYSLAVLLFELLAGVGPYRYEWSSPVLVDLLRAVCERPPRSLSEALDVAAEDGERARELSRRRRAASLDDLRRQLPRRLERALGRALAKSPAGRPQTAAALAEEVRRSAEEGFLARFLRGRHGPGTAFASLLLKKVEAR